MHHIHPLDSIIRSSLGQYESTLHPANRKQHGEVRPGESNRIERSRSSDRRSDRRRPLVRPLVCPSAPSSLPQQVCQCEGRDKKAQQKGQERTLEPKKHNRIYLNHTLASERVLNRRASEAWLPALILRNSFTSTAIRSSILRRYLLSININTFM